MPKTSGFPHLENLLKQSEKGIQQGLQQGLHQGLQQGKLSASKDALVDLLTELFNVVPLDLIQTIDQIDNLFTLKALRKSALKALSIESFKNDDSIITFSGGLFGPRVS
jgi:flagellar biosynthesis/type III secretory pathway protein FliH